MSFRFKLREPFSAASHLLGALIGVFGLAYLVCSCNGSYASILASLIYGLALITLFAVSGLLHGLHCSSTNTERLERLDYAAIYIFIAGTYTPICLFVIAGQLGISLLTAEWCLAFVGAWLALTRGPGRGHAQVAIYLAMGWAFVLALPSLFKALPALPFDLLILGGMLYSIGAIIFTLNSPSIFRTRLSTHDCWHVLVMLGSAAHYAVIVQIIS